MNRLPSALSPYLLQHAGNPVHWQPWDAAALAQAQRQDKPILLSIGYAACHWCHVMAHESFADDKTAALMNADFVNIKVDREERPDIDRIYQAAHVVFTRRGGGWPLTMFLTPAGEPFFGGTYFPPQAQHGLPAFSEVLARVAEVWRTRREAVMQQNEQILPLLRSLDVHPPAAGVLTDAPALAAAEKFVALFDDENGGLGGAPKFPHPVELAFCLQHALANNHATLLAKTKQTLEKMAAGGLRDHLGGGFFRYCVDERWQLPHFEKMLYDNGLLLALYADAAVAFADDDFWQAAAATAEWALAELRAPDGAFYASLDADSAAGEGAFYLWAPQELQQALTAAEYSVFAAHYGIAAAGKVDGKVHLARRQTVAQTAAATGVSRRLCAQRLHSAAAKLKRQRQARQPPAIDDKILTAGNALLCHGLARAGRLAGNDGWLAAARRAFDALWHTLRPGGRTRAARRHLQVSEQGFLDDCAFLLAAALELLQARFCPQLLAAASELADELCQYYQDGDGGGFFFTASDSEVLIRRLKTGEDNATPSGNGVAIRALLLLARLTGEPRWQQAAAAGLRAFYETMARQPTASASLLLALQCQLAPPALVLLTGAAATCRRWQKALQQHAEPAPVVLCLPRQSAALPPPLQLPPPAKGALATVCDKNTCLPPVATLAQLRALLEK